MCRTTTSRSCPANRRCGRREDGHPGFGLEPNPRNSGYGHTPADVAAVRPDGPEALTGYYGEVVARTEAYISGLSSEELGRIVDDRLDPPVTLAARLVSIGDDDLQHVGQAAYVRGLIERGR